MSGLRLSHTGNVATRLRDSGLQDMSPSKLLAAPCVVHFSHFSHFRPATRPLINPIPASCSRRGLASETPAQPPRLKTKVELEELVKSSLGIEDPFLLQDPGLVAEYSDATAARYKKKALKFAQDHGIVFPAKGKALPEHTKQYGIRATTSQDHHFCMNHMKPLGMVGPHPLNEMFFSIYKGRKSKRLWIWVYALMDHNTKAVVRNSAKRRLKAVITAALLENGYRPNGQRLARVAATPEGEAVRDTELHGTFSLTVIEPKKMMQIPLKDFYAYMNNLVKTDVVPRLRRPAVRYPQGYWTTKLETGFGAASKQRKKYRK
ncbi:hypothetical protein B0H67DRAFT_8939 [Lasiosphaeris hirsuta]|uniref:Uncharacterized protein n=1 Tax=Lasiosphaeris hirsuta TaxID=260670 RepID=A0AA40E689_9PEZI|nr:hypothetical protein B0H67DRAFT_8939 [Lasiosphaeris hirsuta]